MEEPVTSYTVGENAVTRLAQKVIETVIPDGFTPETDTKEAVLKLVGSPNRSETENMYLVDRVTHSIWDTARRGDWHFMEIKVVLDLMQAGYDSQEGKLVLGEPLDWVDPGTEN